MGASVLLMSILIYSAAVVTALAVIFLLWVIIRRRDSIHRRRNISGSVSDSGDESESDVTYSEEKEDEGVKLRIPVRVAAQETDQVEEAMAPFIESSPDVGVPHARHDEDAPYVQYYNDSGLTAHGQNGDDYTTVQPVTSTGPGVLDWIIMHPWIYAVFAIAVLILLSVLICIIICCCRSCCRRRGKGGSVSDSGNESGSDASRKVAKGKHRSNKQQDSGEQELVSVTDSEGQEDEDEYSRGVRYFISRHSEYSLPDKSGPLKPLNLGSRMQKHWYRIKSDKNSGQKMLLTIGPVSQSCPLILHKYQRGLNKILAAVKEHPYLHPIDQVDYLVDHQLLVMVQPLIPSGSLKDLIYKTMPLTDWAKKYAQRSRPLATDKIARYGRHILEAMKFLYSQGFPTLGHVQTGNIFVVNDVCQLGGYENTLLGYKTRLFRLCKDDLQHFDIILFGHVIFEMAAGYELTQARPGQADYMAVDLRVKQVLEYIFEEGFPHNITEIASNDFFGASLRELTDYKPKEIQAADMEVLEKVRKGKVRVQKPPGRFGSVSGIVGGLVRSWTQSKSKKKEMQPLLKENK